MLMPFEATFNQIIDFLLYQALKQFRVAASLFKLQYLIFFKFS